MKDPSIEFEPIPDESGTLGRRFFRIPVTRNDTVTLLVRDISYPVSDLSQEGIGICLKDNNAFQIGETLTPCRLTINDVVLDGLTGQVIHCSAHATGQWQFGIQWTAMVEKNREILNTTLNHMKQRILKAGPGVLP